MYQTQDVKYRARLPLWIIEYYQHEAKRTGRSLQEVISEALSDMAYADPNINYIICQLSPEAHAQWVEYRKEVSRKQQQLQEVRVQKGYDERKTPSSGDSVVNLEDIKF